jgi:hypothetical protein
MGAGNWMAQNRKTTMPGQLSFPLAQGFLRELPQKIVLSRIIKARQSFYYNRDGARFNRQVQKRGFGRGNIAWHRGPTARFKA